MTYNGGNDMNAQRRKRLREVHDHLTQAADKLEDIVFEEQECLDNTPENLQESEAYAEREDLIDSMQDALEDIRSSIDSISGLT